MATHSRGDNITKSISMPPELWEQVQEELAQFRPRVSLSSFVQNLLMEHLDKPEDSVVRSRRVLKSKRTK